MQKLLNRSKDLNYSLTGFNGRSDYGPFIAEGVDIPGKYMTPFNMHNNNIIIAS